MKFRRLLPILIMLVVVLMESGRKDRGIFLSSMMISVQGNNMNTIASIGIEEINPVVEDENVIPTKLKITEVPKSAVTDSLPSQVSNPTGLTSALSDMEAAYTDAAGNAIPDFVDLGAGNIGGLTLTPGMYKWTTGVLIPADITLLGGPNDVFILQIGGPLTLSDTVRIKLEGGTQTKNIYWVTNGSVIWGRPVTLKVPFCGRQLLI